MPKKIKVFLLISFLAIFSSNLFAQDWTQMIHQPDANFYKIQESFYKFFDTIQEVDRRGKGHKQFKRWEWFMEPRVFPTGQFPDPTITHQVLSEIEREKNLQEFQVPFHHGVW